VKTDAERVRWLLAQVAVLLVASIALEVIAQVVTGLSPIRETESMLALGPYGAIEKVSFCLRGGLAFLLLKALSLALPRGQMSLWGGISIGYAAAAKFAIAFAVTDPTRQPETVHGVVHAVFAFTSFFASAIGEVLIARKLAENATMPGRLLLRMAWFTVAWTVLVTITIGMQRSIWGLLERVETALLLAWIAIIAIAVQRRIRHATLGKLP
jgi:hypothetical protein